MNNQPALCRKCVCVCVAFAIVSQKSLPIILIECFTFLNASYFFFFEYFISLQLIVIDFDRICFVFSSSLDQKHTYMVYGIWWPISWNQKQKSTIACKTTRNPVNRKTKQERKQMRPINEKYAGFFLFAIKTANFLPFYFAYNLQNRAYKLLNLIESTTLKFIKRRHLKIRLIIKIDFLVFLKAKQIEELLRRRKKKVAPNKWASRTSTHIENQI